MFQSRFDNSSRIEVAIVSKHESLQKPPPSGLVQHVGKAFDQGFQSLAELRTALAHIAEQMASFQFPRHRETGSTGKRISSKGAGVVAGFKNVSLFAHQ